MYHIIDLSYSNCVPSPLERIQVEWGQSGLFMLLCSEPRRWCDIVSAHSVLANYVLKQCYI